MCADPQLELFADVIGGVVTIVDGRKKITLDEREARKLIDRLQRARSEPEPAENALARDLFGELVRGRMANSFFIGCPPGVDEIASLVSSAKALAKAFVEAQA